MSPEQRIERRYRLERWSLRPDWPGLVKLVRKLTGTGAPADRIIAELRKRFG